MERDMRPFINGSGKITPGLHPEIAKELEADIGVCPSWALSHMVLYICFYKSMYTFERALHL